MLIRRISCRKFVTSLKPITLTITRKKSFLHTDKSVYATGEVIWFKAYISNAFSNKLSALSKICYVEVINADKKPVLQAKIDIDSGKG